MQSTPDTVNLLDLTPSGVADFLRSIGEPPSQAGPLLAGVYAQCTPSFSEMPGLIRSSAQKLAERASLNLPYPVEETVSSDALTHKVLFQLRDGNTIESSLMLSHSASGRERRTVCVSSQVGCPAGCPFCATGRQGFTRNLSAGEIIGQVLYFVRRYGLDRKATAERRRWLTNVVFMGMGEPLANYENVVQAVRILNLPAGLGLGGRQVTLSTSGVAPRILQLAGEDMQVELAVSLHAGNDGLRRRLVPLAGKYPLDELMSACREYAARRRRSLFVEYALFDGINDSERDAAELARLLDGLACSVNLIRGNPGVSPEFRPSGEERANAFRERLMSTGIRTTLRRPRGTDIDAGCGQLRSRHSREPAPPAVGDPGGSQTRRG